MAKNEANTMKRCTILTVLFAGLMHINSSFAQTNDPGALKIVEYNNPGLVVDLGVGLWAWPIPMDFDDDGDMDLLVSCPDKPHNGTYFFENLTGGAEPVFSPGRRLTGALKDVQVSYINARPRVLVPGFELSNFKRSFGKEKDSLFPVQEIVKDLKKKPRFNQWKLVDYDNDGDTDIVVGVDDWSDYGWDNAFNGKGKWINGPLHGYLYLIENKNGTYINKGRLKAGGKEIDQYGAPSPNFADFDGDGDLDLICGEFLDKLTWFENTGTREKPVYAKGRILSNEKGAITMDLEMIIPVAVDFDRDGHEDLVVGDEDGRVALIRNTGKVKKGMPVFQSPVYFKQQAEHLKFGALATPYSTDWDDDGDEDIITGNTAGYIGFIENLGNYNGMPRWAAPVLLKAGGKTVRVQAGYNGSIQGPAEAKWGYTTLSVADWDGDGLKDIIVNSIWGKVQWLKNRGTKGAPRLSAIQDVKTDWQGMAPKQPKWNWFKAKPHQLVTQWRTTPYTIDWNADGLMDIVMLDHEGYLAFFERFSNAKGDLVLKPGQRIFYGSRVSGFDSKHSVVVNEPGLLRLNVKENGASGRVKLTITDWNNDGKPDIVLNSLNASVLINRGEKNGNVYFEEAGQVSDKVLAGHTTSPTMVNWGGSNSGLLIGAEDGRFYFMQK
ncbi:VCBS repeat-containing protein [Agriterribacter sp.]|uniref:FG-GAP repeat domain-containing protein n=1 Tax=Agriterribacter sp. TaxID=2821509 RepID=UPI002CB617E1|nr:VCBS repeat-containing protein [Agriterribacter sp.]HRP57729.1 VCBS repeat-containing protein [Agriterribacter sp.]